MSNHAPASVTITSTIGPGLTATASVFSEVTAIEYQFDRNVIKITHANGLIISYYSYAATGTVTQTITAGATAIVIS